MPCESVLAVNTLPKNLPAEARRAATVEAVVALAATQNPGDITTAAIAQHMQLTQGALFRHFANKDAILQAVVEWVAGQLLTRIDQAAADAAASPRAALQAMFMAHVGFVAEHPGVPRIIFGELQRAGETEPKRLVQQLVGSYGGRVRQLLLQGQAQGELHAGLDVQAAATLFIGTIQGLVMQSLITGDMERMRADAPRVFAIYQRGIDADPAMGTGSSTSAPTESTP